MSDPISAHARTITREQLKDVVASLGLTPGEVTEIVMTPREVRVTCIDKRDLPPVFAVHTITVVP